MKTAISLPDALFIEAEQFAQLHGLSRSELYAQALKFYLSTHQHHEMTEMLNELYAEESSSVDSTWITAQMRSLPRDAW